jgi:hypothetical protein
MYIKDSDGSTMFVSIKWCRRTVENNWQNIKMVEELAFNADEMRLLYHLIEITNILFYREFGFKPVEAGFIRIRHLEDDDGRNKLKNAVIELSSGDGDKEKEYIAPRWRSEYDVAADKITLGYDYGNKFLTYENASQIYIEYMAHLTHYVREYIKGEKHSFMW